MNKRKTRRKGNGKGRRPGKLHRQVRPARVRQSGRDARNAAHALLRAVTESVTDALFLKDLRGRYLMINSAGAGLLGRSAAEVIGKDDRALFSPETARGIMESDRRIMKTGSTETFEEVATVAGVTRTYLSTKSAYRDPDGRVIGLLGIARDISEHKRKEEALREKEYLLSESQRIARIGTWLFDLRDRIVWSDETYRVYGVSPDTFIPNPESFLSLIHPEDRPAMQAWIAACLAGEAPGELEFRCILPDGTVRFINGRGELKRDAEKRPIHMTGTAQDITELKRVKMEQMRLLHVLESSVNEIYIFDADTLRFEYVNRVAQDNLGYQIEQLRGMTPLDLKPEFTKPSFRDMLGPLLRRERQTHVFHTVHRRADGSLYPIEVYLQVVEQGEHRRLLAIILDITERRQMEQHRDRLARRLLEIQEEERRMIAGDLHDEIGQALTAIKLNLQRVQENESPGGHPTPVRDSLRIADRVLQQVRDLSLSLHPAMLEDFGLTLALRGFVEQQAARAGLAAEFVADSSVPRLPPPVELACFRIAQEALTNVLRHAQAHRVRVTLLVRPAELELCVQDDGVGFVVAAAQARTQEGAGIGLVNMRERARLLGGTVRIVSVPGQGTEVTARLPVPAAVDDEPEGAAR